MNGQTAVLEAPTRPQRVQALRRVRAVDAEDTTVSPAARMALRVTEERASRYGASVARTRSDRGQAYALRYQVYRQAGSIARNGSQRHYDAHDRQPNARTYLLSDMQHAAAVGSVRASVHLPADLCPRAYPRSAPLAGLDLPCFEGFRDDLEQAIGHSARIVEASHLVMAAMSLAEVRDAQIQLMRMVFANARAHEADWVVATVPRRQRLTYHVLCGMRPLSMPRSVAGAADATMLVGMPFAAYPEMCERQPRLFISYQEALRHAM